MAANSQKLFESLSQEDKEFLEARVNEYSEHLADTTLNTMLMQDFYERNSKLERGESDQVFLWLLYQKRPWLAVDEFGDPVD